MASRLSFLEDVSEVFESSASAPRFRLRTSSRAIHICLDCQSSRGTTVICWSVLTRTAQGNAKTRKTCHFGGALPRSVQCISDPGSMCRLHTAYQIDI